MGGDWRVQATHHRGDGTTTQWGGDEPNAVVLLNELGAVGWELLGPPEVANAVGVARGVDGADREQDVWVSRRFWLRRRVER